MFWYPLLANSPGYPSMQKNIGLKPQGGLSKCIRKTGPLQGQEPWCSPVGVPSKQRAIPWTCK